MKFAHVTVLTGLAFYRSLAAAVVSMDHLVIRVLEDFKIRVLAAER